MKIRATQVFPDGRVITYAHEGHKDFVSLDEALAYMAAHGETVWQIGYEESLAAVFKANEAHFLSDAQDEKWTPQMKQSLIRRFIKWLFRC